MSTHPIRAALIAALALTACAGDPAGGADAGDDDDDGGGFASPTAFNPLTAQVRFDVPGIDPDGVLVWSNGIRVPDAVIAVDPDGVTVRRVLVEALNHVRLDATVGDEIYSDAVDLWAGFTTLDVDVVDPGGEPIDGVTVRATLGDDRRVVAEAVSSGGHVGFDDLPRRTILLEADWQGSHGVVAASPERGATLVLRPLDPPSTIDNNDFSQGLDGWTVSEGAELVPHDGGGAGVQKIAGDMDLLVRADGLTPQTARRTFTVPPDSGDVVVRWRFATREVPGGFFGSQYDDAYSITVRGGSGGVISDAGTMNQLGLPAFDSSGATAWRLVHYTPDPAGDTVEVEATVANVADALLPAELVIDEVVEQELEITRLELFSIPCTGGQRCGRCSNEDPLRYLSVSKHGYYKGISRLRGRIEVRGASDDQLDDLVLELRQGDAVVEAPLSAAARPQLIGVPFGNDATLSIDTVTVLFEPASAELGDTFDPSKPVQLRARARSTNGEEATFELATVTAVAAYAGGNRYGERDDTMGGDGWGRPGTLQLVVDLAARERTLTVGDLSHMHAGNWKSDHCTHTEGLDADVWFNGYNALDGAVARRLIALLTDPGLGPRIRLIYAQPPGEARKPTSPFWSEVLAAEAAGTIPAESIQYADGHTTHFHVAVQERKP